MNFIEKIFYGLGALRMQTPPAFGWFHIISILLIIGTTVFLCLKSKDISEKGYRKIIFWFWIAIVIFEIIKQCLYSYTHYNQKTGEFENFWSYTWGTFPFQFCSSPLYVLPFIAFLPEGKVRDGCLAFVSTFSLFAGLAVIIYPGDVFTFYTFINVQTMLHHGSQIILGIFTFVYYRKKFNLKFVLEGLIVFGCLLAIAMIFNEIIPLIVKDDIGFNMFFISRLYPSTLPLLSSIYPLVVYPIFLIIYIIGFAILAFIVYWILLGISKLVELLVSIIGDLFRKDNTKES